MTTDFVVWESTAGTKYCALGGLQGVPDEYEIKRGISRSLNFPDDAHFKMDKSFSRQVALADSLSNLEGMVVVSPQLRGFLEAEALPSIEFLRVSILSHKERVASTDYCIVNPLQIVDCIDQGRSEIVWNRIDPTLISGCTRFTLDSSLAAAGGPLFRPRYLENLVLVKAELAARIVERGFAGVDFTEIDRFQI
jgi:hypothetical protein